MLPIITAECDTLMGFFNCGNKKKEQREACLLQQLCFWGYRFDLLMDTTVIQINEMQNYIATASNGKTSFLQTGEIIQKML